jgi:HAD superfamily hydrolase (TIGR01509 family)
LTIRGVGERKNELYHQELDSTGVHVFDDVLPCLERLKSADLKLAVVTSSRNRERVVRSAGLEDWFDAAADGETLAEQGLAGKPAGDLFVEATRRLSVAPKHAAAFEDAIAGVQAAADAGCGAVFGVDRSGSGETARRFATNGATHVIKSLVHVDLRTTHEESEASRA